MTVPRRIALVLAVNVLSACSGLSGSVDGTNELVLKPGDRIVALTPSGTLRVEALSEEQRHYAWRDVDRTLSLEPRARAWYGAVGAYHVAAWPSSDTNADESAYNFRSLRDLKYYLAERRPTAYSSEGLVVDFGSSPNGANSVTVQRLCVDHRPPVGLEASKGSSIAWAHGGPRPNLRAWYGCARTTYDPVANDESELRQAMDISRTVDFWSTAGGACSVTGGGGGNGAPSAPRAALLALAPGDTLSFENGNGTFSVGAPTEATRVLRWHNRRANGGAPFTYDTSPRTMTMDLAANGDEPGATGAIACTRISGDTEYAITFNEGALNLAAVSDFRSWLKWADHGPLYLDDAYTGAGMLVGFHVGQNSGSRPMLAVDVIRVCIGGSQPHGLPGAVNTRIRLDPDYRQRPRAWTCPAGLLDVAGTYGELRRRGMLDTPQERRIRAYRGL